MMYKLMLLIWILICSSIMCQAQNVSLTNKCVIEYGINEIENNSIEVSDACEILKSIIKTKIEKDISLNAKFYINPNDFYINFSDETSESVNGLTYEVTIKNKGTPALDNITLIAQLCDGLVYANSKYRDSTTAFYKPNLIKTNNTSEIRWQIGTLQPGEERSISLNAIYLDKELPKIDETEFKMNARLWGHEIFKKNGHITEISPP